MILAGIDEAGYGPLLGPLCVGLVVMRIEGDHSSEPGSLPDLWARLHPGVVNAPKLAGATAVAVADSKRLKLPNSVKTRHPLHHLERGVLSLGHEAVRGCCDDLALCEAVGGSPPAGRAWWSGPGVPLPLGCSRDELTLLRAHVLAACERGGVRVVDARCLAMDAPEFNAALRVAVRRHGIGAEHAGESPGDVSKARVLFAQVVRHLRRLWCSAEAALAGADAGMDPPRVVVDRQGGRTDYLGVLREGFPEAAVHCMGMNTVASAYELRTHGQDARRLRVLFRTEAESYAMPVALASMLAKLTRELWMRRFNAHWCGLMPGLKPTAGYTTDGRRWLDDARGLFDDEVRSLLCRNR